MLYNISGELNESLIESSMNLHNEQIAKDVINNLSLAQKTKAQDYIEKWLSFSSALNEIYTRETVKALALTHSLSIGKYVKLWLLPTCIFEEVIILLDSKNYSQLSKQLFDKLISNPFDLLPSQCKSEIEYYEKLISSWSNIIQIDNYINNKNLLPSQIFRAISL